MLIPSPNEKGWPQTSTGTLPHRGTATDGMPRPAVGSAGWQAHPAEVQHASTTANLLKEGENGLTNLWSPSFAPAADTAGGTHKPNGFIYLSVLILA